MKFRFLLHFLMLAGFLAALNAQEPYQYGKQILSIEEELETFHPREENSRNERLLFSYLEEQFGINKVSYETIDYSRSETGHSFSKGYHVSINGDREDRLLLIIPLNNGENQNAMRSGSINIATGIQLMRIFSSYSPPVSIDFLFLGAERGNEEIYPIGSRQFLKDFSEEKSAAIYLDLEAPGDQLIIRNSSDEDLSPLWLVEKLSRLFIGNELDVSTESIESLAFQSGFESAPSLINTYISAEVPMVLLQSRPSDTLYMPEDQWLNSFVESILAFILHYQEGFPTEWDRHYIIAEFEGLIFTLGEKDGIILFTIISASLLLVLLFKSRNLHLNLKRFRNHIWTLPLLFFLTFLYLFLATLIIEDISGLRDYPDFWMQFPLLFLLFKIFLSLFLYSGFLFIIRGISVSPSHHFYTYSAFLAVIISLITVMIINISFSYFFLWSLLGISIFMMSRNKTVKRIAIIITPLPLLYVGFRIFSEPYYEICRFLLTSRISGNIFFTIIIMPSLMLLSSLNHFLHRFHRHRKSFRNTLSLFLWGGLAILTLYHILTIKTFNEENSQPVFIEEVIDLTESSRSISISSPAPVGDIDLELDQQTLRLKDVGRQAQITAPMISGMLEVQSQSSTFLDRLSIRYDIEALGSPDKVSIELQSDNPLILFDSNFPSEMSADGKNVRFYIGSNPQLPLTLDIILSRTAEPQMNIDLEYSDFPYQFSLSDNTYKLHKKLTVSAVFPWES